MGGGGGVVFRGGLGVGDRLARFARGAAIGFPVRVETADQIIGASPHTRACAPSPSASPPVLEVANWFASVAFFGATDWLLP